MVGIASIKAFPNPVLLVGRIASVLLSSSGYLFEKRRAAKKRTTRNPIVAPIVAWN